MKKETTNDIIEKLAEKESVQGSEIWEEMRKAILAAYATPKNRFLWDNLFGERRLPSPEEFIMKLSGIVVKRRAFPLAEAYYLQKSSFS